RFSRDWSSDVCSSDLLAVDSATRYVESRRRDGKDETVRRFEKFGADFVKYDSWEFLASRQEIDRYREILLHDVIRTRQSRDSDEIGRASCRETVALSG